MKRLAFILAALLCASAHADLIARNGNDSVRLTQAPCSPAVLRHIPEGYRGPFRAAEATIDGQRFEACWAARMDGTVMAVYGDGDVGLIPIDAFKDE
jgi:hypothetical protein